MRFEAQRRNLGCFSFLLLCFRPLMHAAQPAPQTRPPGGLGRLRRMDAACPVEDLAKTEDCGKGPFLEGDLSTIVPIEPLQGLLCQIRHPKMADLPLRVRHNGGVVLCELK